MKKFISLYLALVLLTSSLAYGQRQSSCENGECIEKMVEELQDLGSVYEKQCLPAHVKETELEKYYEQNGLSEDCWKIITEINHLEGELQKHQTRLEQRLGCESGECKLPDSLNSQLSIQQKTEEKISCTEPKKEEIKNKCPQDLGCVLTSTAMGMGGYLAEMMAPKEIMKGCHLGDDSCFTQLASGFLKATVNFFKGTWDLLKLAGNKIGESVNDFWNKVSGAEDHSSTAQLAMAKASEDPGVFDMLKNDFSGTMGKIWQAFVVAIKEWLKNDIFCNKWQGVPHFGTCLAPTESFDCIPCKTMVNGLCAVSGTVLSEVVPAFLTGGLVTAAKHGAKGAGKLARLFKVSDTTIDALKNSRAAKMAVAASTKVDDALKLSQGLRAAKASVETALALLKRYLLSPTRKMAKASFTSISAVLKKGSAYIAETPVGKILVFNTEAAKKLGRVLIYPIDNPLTATAFRVGMRSFDTAFTLASPKLVASSVVTGHLLRSDVALEQVLIKVEVARKKGNAQEIVREEAELLKQLEAKRAQNLDEILKQPKVEFSELIRHLYPELQYGDLAKTLPTEKILAAEKELYLKLEQMNEGPLKKDLLQKYHAHVVQGAARSQIVGETSPAYKAIVDNSKLADEERFNEAMKLLKRGPLSKEEAKKLSLTLQEAHLAGNDGAIFEYTWRELREKYRILSEGGFSKKEAELLIRSGLAGRPPVRELIRPGQTLFSGYAEDILKRDYLTQKDELYKLIHEKTDNKKRSILDQIGDMLGGKVSRNPSADNVIDNFESLYFVDYRDTIEDMEDISVGMVKVSESTLSLNYEEKAFKNFQATRNYLLEERPPINKETLLEIHRRMMKDGVEDVPDEQLGAIRSGHWRGGVPPTLPIDEKILLEIRKNPYLTWKELGKTPEGKYFGEVVYPNVDDLKPEGIELIRVRHPELTRQIEEFQSVKRERIKKRELYFSLSDEVKNGPDGKKMVDEITALTARYNALEDERFAITQKLVNTLTDDLMDWFTRERTRIGDINTPEKLDEFIDVLAKFQKDLVSIHPVANGNGRSSRELALSYALMKEGFPPPRIIDPNADIYNSVDDWKRIIKHGILASDYLIDDMVERLKFDLPMENSLDLISPYSRPGIKVPFKNKKDTYMDGIEYIDPRFYREMVRRELETNPKLGNDFKNNPIESWDKLHKKVEESFLKNNAYYEHPKNGVERISIGYVDSDFKHLFGKASFNNKELFDFKMKTWYTDDINWRGLSSRTQAKTEEEIIHMFKELDPHNASNNILRRIEEATPENIRKAALEDFDTYNDDIFDDGLVEMARDHSQTGPKYAQSYGYSTSKNREVGEAYAMGAMVVGKYGEHRAPELQALLKSRVLVGTRRAQKDVDLGRLKQLREDFSYEYGRQQEVMGIGAADPDAVTIVQTIDAKGNVIYSYLRNKNNPAQIQVIKGDIAPDAVPTPDQIEKTIELN